MVAYNIPVGSLRGERWSLDKIPSKMPRWCECLPIVHIPLHVSVRGVPEDNSPTSAQSP